MSFSLRRHWMPAALLASLGANLFLGGFLLGQPHRPPPGPPDPQRFVERLASTLPEADAAVVRRIMAANRDALVADRERRFDMPRRIAAALKAEPFDPQALSQLFAEDDRQDRAVRLRIQAAIIEVAAAISPEGRKRMAEFRPGPPGP